MSNEGQDQSPEPGSATEKREQAAKRWWDVQPAHKKIEIFEKEVPERERRDYVPVKLTPPAGGW